jgi:hypothetical protein
MLSRAFRSWGAALVTAAAPSAVAAQQASQQPSGEKWQTAVGLLATVVEVARGVTYVGLALLLVAILLWAFVTSGGTNWDWTQAVVVVFTLAMVVAVTGLLLVLL